MHWIQEKECYILMTTEEKRKYYTSDKYVELKDIICWGDYSLKINSCNQSIVDINNHVSLYFGNIIALEVDVIVNAANDRLRCGGGVDSAIHNAANRKLLMAECRSLDGCETGNCKITGGYCLPAKYVIHAVGPFGENKSLLQSCYQRALELLERNNLKSIAFPCISTGIYEYPNENAAHIALSTVRNWFDTNEYSKQVERVIFCLFLPIDVKIYNELMPKYFPLQ